MHKIVETYILENNLSNEAEIWPLLKYQMTRNLVLSKGVDDMEFKSKSYITLFFATIMSIINLLLYRFSKRKIAYFGAFSRVSIRNGFIVDEFVSSYKKNERYSLYHCSNFKGFMIVTCIKQRVIFENLVVKLLCYFIKLVHRPNVLSPISENFFDLLNHEYGISKQKIQVILYDYECKKIAYKWILKWLNVTCVEVVSAYTKPAIVSAANELGIKTLEFQHGLLAPYHPSYHYYGCELWRSSLLPISMKLYSNFWQSKMEAANFVSVNGIEVEGPLKEISTYDKENVYTLVGSERFFIFTGQGICYSDIAIFIIDVLNTFPDYSVIYRPHPREHKNYAYLSEKINNKRFKVIDRELFDNTLSLIGASKAHISIFSSCHFEALELIGRTYVLDVINNNIMKLGGEDENVIFVKNASQIIDF